MAREKATIEERIALLAGNGRGEAQQGENAQEDHGEGEQEGEEQGHGQEVDDGAQPGCTCALQVNLRLEHTPVVPQVLCWRLHRCEADSRQHCCEGKGGTAGVRRLCDGVQQAGTGCCS